MDTIKRIFRMHGSLVLTLPKPTCRALEIAAGDYVTITTEPANKLALITKVDLPEKPDHVPPKPAHRQPARG